MANTVKNSILVVDGSHAPGFVQKRLIKVVNNLPRLGILFGLIVLIAAEVILVSLNKIIYGIALIALPVLIILGKYLINHLEFSAVAILITAAFIPLKIPTGRGSPLVGSLLLSIFLVGIWIIKMMLVDKRLVLKPSPANIPALGFMAVTVISLIWSNILRDPLVSAPSIFVFVQLGAASVMVISPAVTLLVANLIDSLRHIKIMVGIILAIGVIGLVENFLNVNLLTVIGGLTSAWIVCIAFGLALFNDHIRLGWKVALIGLVGAWFLWNLVLNLNWYAGWLPGLVAVCVIAFLRSKRLFLAILVLLAVYILINRNSIADNIVFKQSNDGDTRLAAWNANWSITSQHLLLGTGPAGYAAYYMSLFPNQAMATHNNYIDIIAETGIVGTVFFLWLFGALVWQGFKVVRRLRGRRDFLEAVSVAIFGGLIGCIAIMAFGDWMVPFAYTQTIAGFNYTVYSWLFIGALLSLDYLTQKELS